MREEKEAEHRLKFDCPPKVKLGPPISRPAQRSSNRPTKLAKTQ